MKSQFFYPLLVTLLSLSPLLVLWFSNPGLLGDEDDDSSRGRGDDIFVGDEGRADVKRRLKLTQPSTSLEEPPEFIPDGPDTSPLRRPLSIPKGFTIEEEDFCTKRPGLQIIAYVHSAISRVELRSQTRASWASASSYDMGPMNVSLAAVFMVGRAKNELERRIVQEESQRYHDIVQGEYGDHYRLLSYKAVSSLYWVNRHCPHVPWTLHSDDDAHVDAFLSYEVLRQLDDDSRQRFVCDVIGGPVCRSGRWKVRYEEYGAEEYPPYCAGAAWFLQTKLIPRLLRASEFVPFLWVDDAYVTGLLAKEAGIKLLNFHRYYGSPEVETESLGREFVWLEKAAPRSVWWEMIVNYHRNHSMSGNVKR